MKYRILLTTFAAATLAGCSFTSTDEQNQYRGDFMFYQCSADQTFKLALMPNDNLALLRLPKKDYRLIQVPSGSGTKYIQDDGTAETPNVVTLFTKGKEARLEIGEVIYKNCLTQ
ncbi:hypothetical protein TW81_14720 [Vibrio galatheae]|uniref:C-type lysozyme inhibitor domain-containing protein n=1 Tax=Vibrio galatheae TaxID=579748 RepID=A0A0F4NHL3_9VIBR|nr:MliC family protein [Vibrio galatheae]KJY82348.1 hypothetical protein TW81_14720 [Vibrio galatheae]